MYRTQKGCFPSLTSSIGGLLFVGFLTYLVISDVLVWFEVRSAIPPEMAIQRIIIALIVSLLFLLFFMPFTLMIAGMFPAVRVTKKGLKYRYLGFWGGLILWNEIEEIIDLKWPHNYKAIVISRKGFFLVNGLWSHTFYGLLFIGQLEPILLLSSSIRDREKLQNDIYKNKGEQNLSLSEAS